MTNIRKMINDIVKVASSSVFVLISSILFALVLPKLISVTDYSNYKIFTLYIGYLGFLMFGFNDGIYLEYGGVDYNKLDKKKFRTYAFYILLLQTIFSLIILSISFFVKGENKFIILSIALYILPFMIIGYFQQISQITQRYNEFSFLKVINSVLNILVIVSLFILSKTKYQGLVNYQTYIISIIVINLLLSFWYIYRYRDIIFGSKNTLAYEKSNIINLHKIGIPLLFSNLTTILLLNIDRQFVSVLFDKITYGIYAFAYNLLTMVTTIISAISIIFYPILKQMDADGRKKLYQPAISVILIISFGSMLLYFPLIIFINWFLPNYNNSLIIFQIIFPSLALTSAVNLIIYNFYKVDNMSKKFFLISVFVLIISIIFNIIAYLIFRSPLSISVASVISLFIWYLIADYKIAKLYKIKSFKNLAFIILMIISFYLVSFFFNWWSGMLFYLSLFLVIVFALYYRDFKKWTSFLKNKQ